MKEKTVLFIDSGSGGFVLLDECLKLVKGLNFTYFFDDMFSPYGEKGKKSIEKRTIEIVESVMKRKEIQAVVLACNTATACAAKKMRENFNFPTIGIEPAAMVAINHIKKEKCLASKNENDEKILVLCTPLTKKHAKIFSIINKEKIIFCCPKKLPKLIDENFFNIEKTQQYLNQSLKKVKSENFSKVCLGCTHFFHATRQIENACGKNLLFFRSEKGTAKNFSRIAKKCKFDCEGKQEFASSLQEKNVQEMFEAFQKTSSARLS